MSDPQVLLREAENVRKICRQMCINAGVEPDKVAGDYTGKEIKNWECLVDDVNTVLRAIKAIAS